MATNKEISQLLSEWQLNSENFEEHEIPMAHIEECNVQKIGGKLYLWLVQSYPRKKGFRLNTIAQLELIKAIVNNPKTERLIKLMEKL